VLHRDIDLSALSVNPAEASIQVIPVFEFDRGV